MIGRGRLCGCLLGAEDRPVGSARITIFVVCECPWAVKRPVHGPEGPCEGPGYVGYPGGAQKSQGPLKGRIAVFCCG